MFFVHASSKFDHGIGVANILKKYDLNIIEDTTLNDLNKKYFKPLGRELPDNEIFMLERFLLAKFQ